MILKPRSWSWNRHTFQILGKFGVFHKDFSQQTPRCHQVISRFHWGMVEHQGQPGLEELELSCIFHVFCLNTSGLGVPQGGGEAFILRLQQGEWGLQSWRFSFFSAVWLSKTHYQVISCNELHIFSHARYDWTMTLRWVRASPCACWNTVRQGKLPAAVRWEPWLWTHWPGRSWRCWKVQGRKLFLLAFVHVARCGVCGVWSHLKLWIFHGKSLYFYIITKLYIDIKTTILQDWRELACFLEGDPISVKLWPLHHLWPSSQTDPKSPKLAARWCRTKPSLVGSVSGTDRWSGAGHENRKGQRWSFWCSDVVMQCFSLVSYWWYWYCTASELISNLLVVILHQALVEAQPPASGNCFCWSRRKDLQLCGHC